MDVTKGHNLEEALLTLQVVLQGGLGVIDGGVPGREPTKGVTEKNLGSDVSCQRCSNSKHKNYFAKNPPNSGYNVKFMSTY